MSEWGESPAFRRAAAAGRAVGAAMTRRVLVDRGFARHRRRRGPHAGARGDRIAIHARTHAAAARLNAELGGGHLPIAADLSTVDTVAGAGRQCGARPRRHRRARPQRRGVRGAAIARTPYPDWLAAWRRVLEINLLASAALAHRVVDHLLHRPKARPAGGSC